MANDLIEPKEVEIEGRGGIKRKYIVSLVPWIPLGRELSVTFVPTIMPKVGDYDANAAIALKMYKYIEAVKPDGTTIRLSTPELASNHVPDIVTGWKLEAAMLEHNLGFSVPEKISGLLEFLSQAIGQLSTQILTGLQAQSLPAEKPQSTN